MISSRDLTDEQVASIRSWAADGAQLNDIQKRLREEFGMNATYMDTRFLVLDLGVELVSEDSDEPAESVPDEAPAEAAVMPEDASPPAEEPAPSPLDPNAPAASVTVAVDELTRPGAMVSGSVVFSDGEKALWMIDELGRLGLDPTTPGYQPSEADIGVFQEELRRQLGG